ncbi:hypothetical protein FGE12_09345 [Aggregicoccus sp. 17bor-14]|uniref:hypothetical protein n=1 Tax=Myxococcaceae TaxID=31 RepID=UPI00129CDAE8|nr:MULTISPECIES: hypothetical protein [Myxococcaceae]MBF5042604.1 hypothetical protein [Simulacricoccus sp. 17bor-14]MRI88372.1 hypothetical protein [Aggregicoccus sp. 17bor-14]
MDPLPGAPEAVPATVADSPTAPPGADGAALPWTSAPLMEGVQVLANYDSALLVLPLVDGARDYRAFALVNGVKVSVPVAGQEQVDGALVHCAGYRQHNAKAQATLELLRQLDVTALSGPTRVVVEAVDAACPFPGVIGSEHGVVDVTNNVEVKDAAKGLHEVYTADEIRTRYGSLIVNGHGPGPRPGAQAAPVAPRVLARTTLLITPRAAPTAPSDFFDGFTENDQPKLVGSVKGYDRAQNPRRYMNAKWNFYTYGSELTQFFVDRGQLHTLIADVGQDVFASNIAYPKHPAKLYDEGYLHVSYEVASDATSRRYWWISLCGAATEGATMEADGALKGSIIQTPFFHQEDGQNPSIELWNCLQVFPRDGWPFTLAPSNKRPESDIRVMVNLANKPTRSSVVNVSPDQYHEPNIAAPGWFRTQDAAGKLLAPILDDQMLIAPRARYDLYVRRGRVVLYVNGQQRLCNDFPSVKLTMAEAAVGFGQVLYHSAGERIEFFSDSNDRTGQRYYLQNTPFMDERSWDNLGLQENVAAPPTFDPSVCYTYKG